MAVVLALTSLESRASEPAAEQVEVVPAPTLEGEFQEQEEREQGERERDQTRGDEAPVEPEPGEARPSESTPRDEAGAAYGEGEAGEARTLAPAILTGSLTLAAGATAVVYTIRAAELRRRIAADLDAGVQYDAADPRLARGRRDAATAAVMVSTTAILGALTIYYLVRGTRRRGAGRGGRGSRARALAWTGVISF